MSLAERVEGLQGPDEDTDILIARWLYDNGGKPVNYDPQLYVERHGGWTGSLDAVVALIGEKLPAVYAWTLGQNVHHRYWIASINSVNDEGAPTEMAFGTHKRLPVLALLSAALRAMEAGDE